MVNGGQLTEERIDVSVKRVLRDKFKLGLFDNPYVDVEASKVIAGNSDFRKKGKLAQQKSTVLLKNEGLLPLKKTVKLYVHGAENKEAYASLGELVSSPDKADVVVARIQTPYDERTDYFLESFFHQGRLYYSEEEKKEILDLIQDKPSIVVATLERPAILTEVSAEANALLVDFGTSDEALVGLLSGEVNPKAKLPFELPSSQEAVEKQLEDVPYDSENPLYPFGFGVVLLGPKELGTIFFPTDDIGYF